MSFWFLWATIYVGIKTVQSVSLLGRKPSSRAKSGGCQPSDPDGLDGLFKAGFGLFMTGFSPSNRLRENSPSSSN